MKSVFVSFITLILIIANCNSYADENKILVKVDNEIITSYDLLIEMSYLGTINKNYNTLGIEKSIEIAKNSLIREKVKELELKKYIKAIELEKEQLNKISINYFKKFGINNIEDFNKYFLAQNINPEIIKKKITIEILWNQFIYNNYSNRVKFDEELIRKEIKETNKKNEFLLSEILFDLSNKENLRDKFENIKKEISNNGFVEAALKFSISDTAKEGGKLGWIKSTVLSKSIKDQLIKTKIGSYTNPITIPGGFLILKIEDIKSYEDKVDLDKELKFIIQKKTEQQLNQFSNIHLKKVQKDIKINEL